MRIFLLLISTVSFFSYSNIEINIKEEFKSNSVNVTSVSEILENKKNKGVFDIGEDKNKNLLKYCSSEIDIFCHSVKDKLSCLQENEVLITGECSKVISKKNDPEYFFIHDLKISKNIEYLNLKKYINYKEYYYKINDVFYYRGLLFRKGITSIRTYENSSYNGEYIISSGYPRYIFKDRSGIEYNPFLQKGPYFFDDKGNVTIGTLGEDYEYKKNLYLKKGTIVAFNDERELIKGTVAKSVRIGKCGFLAGMDISYENYIVCNKK